MIYKKIGNTGFERFLHRAFQISYPQFVDIYQHMWITLWITFKTLILEGFEE